jgi:uncharacterized protein YqgC (DUF456 family)
MTTLLHLLGLAALAVVCLAGLASLLLGLPGTFVILGAALVYAWATDFAVVHWGTLLWLSGLALVAEGIEFLAAARAPAGARPSRRVAVAAILGALIGGIVGAPFFFGLGSLLGAFAGAFAGAALAAASQGRSLDDSLRTGLAALRGRLLGFVVKSAIAVAMVLLLAAAILR